jgi:hypothetical protein
VKRNVLLIGLALLTTAALAGFPQAALGASFVDAAKGHDSGPCTKAKPCATIATALAKSGAGTTIEVAGGLYKETLVLNGGRSLVHKNFTGPKHAKAIIDGGPNGAIEVTGTAAGQVKGFTIRSRLVAVDLEKAATLSDDVFDQDKPPTTPSGAVVVVASGGTGSLITKSRFSDPKPGDEVHIGVEVMSSSPTISNCSFTGMSIAVQVDGGGLAEDPLIRNNRIEGAHQGQNDTVMYLEGVGVLVNDSDVTLIGNLIRKPREGDRTVGIHVDSSDDNNPDAGGTLERNRVFGQTSAGVALLATTGDSLNDDVLASNLVGLRLYKSDVPLTNETIAGNRDVEIGNSGVGATVELNSTIVGDRGTDVDTCTSTYSRGPSSDGCDFATSANPAFVNAGADDFHLRKGSALIDAGDPLAPVAPNLFDLDGDPRALSGNCRNPGSARRDIGADEFKCP